MTSSERVADFAILLWFLRPILPSTHFLRSGEASSPAHRLTILCSTICSPFSEQCESDRCELSEVRLHLRNPDLEYLEPAPTSGFSIQHSLRWPIDGRHGFSDTWAQEFPLPAYKWVYWQYKQERGVLRWTII